MDDDALLNFWWNWLKQIYTENNRQVNSQNRWKVNVWCGIVESKIIGPFVFNESLNENNYLHFLTNKLNALLENVSLETRITMWFQQDEGPDHYSTNEEVVYPHGQQDLQI
ncbi:hypothetical protein D910_08372 [Dendroctonus ponderosae]|uniref:Transposable element Tc3 transposase n=1 Tax=Dendroctonus ponderosae TaxID=77166 RepID=U4ULZ9_DENPD|nr:hypothetical protein D910_08372 [Dendroctonus ponderosae]